MRPRLAALGLALCCSLALPSAPTLASSKTPTMKSTGFKQFATSKGTATLVIPAMAFCWPIMKSTSALAR
jgi:hypothetical protein